MLDILKIKTRDQRTDKIKLYYHCVRNFFKTCGIIANSIGRTGAH